MIDDFAVQFPHGFDARAGEAVLSRTHSGWQAGRLHSHAALPSEANWGVLENNTATNNMGRGEYIGINAFKVKNAKTCMDR